ncbi:hypothetical protein pb186bvf_005657 [Paramecium bursaria]
MQQDDDLILGKPYKKTQIQNDKFQKNSFLYFPYQGDFVDDFGWGCAWRCIQMILSQLQEYDQSLKDLINKYGWRKVLEDIYLKLNTITEIPEYLQDSKFAPEDNLNRWAEPFITQLVLFDQGVRSELFLVNLYPPSSNAPIEVFQKDILNFQQFVAYLLEHFDKNKGLVNIDDSTYAMIIYGIQKQGNKIILNIADPHINSNKTINYIGLYDVLLDENGDQLSNTITEQEKQYYSYVGSYQGIQFNKKPWMVCVNKGKI